VRNRYFSEPKQGEIEFLQLKTGGKPEKNPDREAENLQGGGKHYLLVTSTNHVITCGVEIGEFI